MATSHAEPAQFVRVRIDTSNAYWTHDYGAMPQMHSAETLERETSRQLIAVNPDPPLTLLQRLQAEVRNVAFTVKQHVRKVKRRVSGQW